MWASIRRTDEALDKCEQYIFDIEWSTRRTGEILAERIISYVERSGQRELLSSGPAAYRLHVPPRRSAVTDRNAAALQLAFESPFPWGGGKALPHRVVHIYSASRPRWAAQLCRMAGDEVLRSKDTHIKMGHIKQVLEKYGQFRLDDITREHKHQCIQIADIVNAFSRQFRTFTSDQLLAFVSKILRYGAVELDGDKTMDALVLSHFLFRTSFIIARTPKRTGLPLRYYRYEEKPELLTNYANIDDGLLWDIHPSFHAALNLREAS